MLKSSNVDWQFCGVFLYPQTLLRCINVQKVCSVLAMLTIVVVILHAVTTYVFVQILCLRVTMLTDGFCTHSDDVLMFRCYIQE